jgi:hypothetical protein
MTASARPRSRERRRRCRRPSCTRVTALLSRYMTRAGRGWRATGRRSLSRQADRRQPHTQSSGMANCGGPAGVRSTDGLHDRRNGARRDPEDRRQTIDRDHQHVLITPLHSTSSNETQDPQRAAATPPSPAARQPGRLLVQTGEVTSVVGPGFGLDHNPDPGGGDRHRVDVAPALPGQRMSQPPALSVEGLECALHFVLRASADATTTSKRKPMASVEPERCGCEEQQPGERRRSCARGQKPEQPGDDASQARFASV